MHVCIVIVTYNRKDELKKCIAANLNQTIDADILVVDNASSDGTQDVIKDYKNNKHIKYIKLPVNLGGAGGFYYGMKRAFESGKFDYVWLMDDDGRPMKDNCLETILDATRSIQRKDIILNSLVTSDVNTLSFGLKGEKSVNKVVRTAHNDFVIGEINPFNGTLISYETYQKIGLPRKEYFIKGDEIEYFWRAKKNNIFVATCVLSIFYHPELQFECKKIMGKEMFIIDEPYWKLYYRARNRLMNLKLYSSKKEISWHIVQTVYSALCCKNDRKMKLRYSIIGLLDGVRNDFRRIKIN